MSSATVARVVDTAVALVNDSSVKEQLRLGTINTFGESEWWAMEKLLVGESGLNPFAVNPTSGACGIFQALPCAKLGCDLADVSCQVNWGMNYIKNRYGTPTGAYNAWLSRSPHWY